MINYLGFELSETGTGYLVSGITVGDWFTLAAGYRVNIATPEELGFDTNVD